MSYNCEVCRCHVAPRKKRLLHVVYRKVPALPRLDHFGLKVVPFRTEVEREIPCCSVCKGFLDRGSSVVEVRKIAAQVDKELDRLERTKEIKGKQPEPLPLPVDMLPELFEPTVSKAVDFGEVRKGKK